MLTIVLSFAAILVFGALLLIIIAFSKRGPKGLNVEEFRCEWMRIERQLNAKDASTYQMAILNADKLLDKALRDSGVAGETMGERMKQQQKVWSDANAVWNAHKLRNKIAHETSVSIDYKMTRRAMAAFKQALKDVGAV